MLSPPIRKLFALGAAVIAVVAVAVPATDAAHKSKKKTTEHWRYPSTGSNPHEAGQKGGPLHMNLIHRREGFYNKYTLSIRG